MRSADTSSAAEAARLDALRRLSGGERVRLAFEASLMAREFALAGMRRDQPGRSDAELARDILRRQFPPDRLPPPLR